ncbi:MAG TPA: dockerin type I domain-containing protein, partial [Saprospiraceae bacterium]|nr:dockerin type I domain-containing protein [Saprospiraceae bacterium]
LFDCQPFVDSLPISLTNIIIPVGGQITLYAQDFIGHPLDDCSKSGEFSFSFSRDQYQPTYTYHCCNIPAYGVEVPLTFWVADKGRDLNCDNKIEWEERAKDSIVVQVVFTDNANPCDCEDDISIQGLITTEDVQTVSKVSVNLLSPGHLYPTYITGEDGKYVITHIVVPSDVTVTAERNDNHKNGVSTLDLVRIQKHLLGIEQFTSPYDLIAADANNSQNVSAIDLVELRKLILGRYDELPNIKSWRFVDKNFAIQDTANPWPFRSYIPLSATGTITNADFIAIKVGDVNNTVNPKAKSLFPRESYPLLPFTVSPKEYEPNEIISIDFSMDNLKSINGFQFTLSDYDLEFISASSNIIDLQEVDYALFGDKMTMSWFNLDATNIIPGDILFTIKAVANKEGSLQQTLQLNSDITEAELYSSGEQIFTPRLLFNSDTKDQLIVFPVQPNPWSNVGQIPFRLATASNVQLKVYSTDGSQIFSEEKFYESGYHEMKLNAVDIPFPGLLYFNLQSAEGMQGGKMFLVK